MRRHVQATSVPPQRPATDARRAAPRSCRRSLVSSLTASAGEYENLSGQKQGTLPMRFRLAVGALAAGILLPLAASAQQVTWTVGFVNAVGSSYLETLKTVPDRIEKATGGKLKIELYDTLVNGPEQPAAVRDGRLDASFAVSPWLSAEAPYMNFGHLPGLLTEVATYQKMLDPLLRGETAKVWETKYGAVQLMTGVF